MQITQEYQALIGYARTTYGYAWYDGAVQLTMAYKPNVGQSTTYTTTNALSATGVINTATINDGRPRTVAFTNDVYGQTLKRVEADGNPSQGDPRQLWYRFNGREMGTVGNNGALDMSYTQSIPDRGVSSGTGAFRHGASAGQSYASFGDAFTPINSYAQGSSGGSVTVQAGDTLSGIAARLWGDGALWYKLAEANGLGAGTALPLNGNNQGSMSGPIAKTMTFGECCDARHSRLGRMISLDGRPRPRT